MPIAAIAENGRNTTHFADWKAPGPAAMTLVGDGAYPNPKAFLGEPTQRRSTLAVGGLPGNLAAARDLFHRESSGERKTAVAYDLAMDRVLYRVLAEERGKPGYEATKEALNAYVKMQLETHLGERLHVGISRFDYDIVDGQLLTEDTGEPMLEMIQRGREYRLNHGKDTDRKREKAEVVGFAKIQEIMADENTSVGTMVMFASPPGNKEKESNYLMNLYEVHQKVSEKKSVAYRFTSGLSAEETKKKFEIFDPWYQQDGIPTDAEFIKHVVRLPFGLFKSPEAVHAYMHKEHDYLSVNDFAILKQSWQPIMDKIVGDFERDPDARTTHEQNHRALLNYADETHDTLQDNKMTIATDAHRDVRPWIAPQIDMKALAKKQVRFVMAGCGGSGDGDTSKVASVSEFDPKNKKEGAHCGLCGMPNKDNHYHCPKNEGGCGQKYADETTRKERTQECSNPACKFKFQCK